MRQYRTLRWGVQLFFVLLTVWIGCEFVLFYQQVKGMEPVTIHRPAGVEAFLPISALLGLKRWLFTGLWDEIHPAGLTLLLAFLIGTVVARRAFCSWICPVGTLSRGLEWLRYRLLRLPPRWKVPMLLRRVAALAKYPLLCGFLWVIGSMPLSSIEEFLHMPYNVGADGAMLKLFLHLSLTGTLVVGVLFLFSLILRNGWCRVLCPYGALFGVVGVLSPFRIRRDVGACKSCGACTRACGMGIPVGELTTVNSLECTTCLSCVSACRVNGALGVRAVWGARVRPWLLPAGALAVLFVAYGLARATGHWDAVLPLDNYRFAYLFGGHG
ncbi:4Fe-4S binding protein [Telmatospirillum siberiense]|uniref:4Fe-4S ferredoxin n=1 Tax=Telmatospirillum siberiense TaxID=382514 RepID=A0A2N3PZM0_9PROT|nr:4Fe-4S binding protein [Telmatospirillum siberiense]PKU25845.1 4Fe-4S ferredoxin [Telmatospirillum siberiense]